MRSSPSLRKLLRQLSVWNAPGATCLWNLQLRRICLAIVLWYWLQASDLDDLEKLTAEKSSQAWYLALRIWKTLRKLEMPSSAVPAKPPSKFKLPAELVAQRWFLLLL